MTQNNNVILSVKNLCKYFPVYSEGFWRKQTRQIKAVDDVSFDLCRGKVLGLVGESGCGKTTVARTILRAYSPTSGKVKLNIDDGSVDLSLLSEKELKTLRTKMQMIFQDPFSSLNPRMTVGDIIAEPLKIHKLASGKQLKNRVSDMLEKVGLSKDYMNRYPHAFSGGQRQRIGIARALITNPSLVIADEAVSALDVSVQAQILNLLIDLKDEFNLTYLFISHDLAVVQHICDQVAVMYAGKIVEYSDTKTLFDDPKHPYTRLLMRSIPSLDPDVTLKTPSIGEVLDLSKLPAGCRFAPRCSFKKDVCERCMPKLNKFKNEHYIACHLY